MGHSLRSLTYAINAVAFIVLFLQAPSAAQSELNEGFQTLFDTEGEDGDALGAALAMDDDALVAGAPMGEAALVYRHDGSTWTREQVLSPPGNAPGDNFGTSVAMAGHVIAVGAPFHDGDNETDAGAVYLFRYHGSEWKQIAKLMPPTPSPNLRFGRSLAMTREFILVGAANQAFVYRAAGRSYGLDEILTHPEGSGADFGRSVAVDGMTFGVGDPDFPENVNGSLTLFERDESGNFMPFVANNPESGEFGLALDIDGNRIAVGGGIAESTSRPVVEIFRFDPNEQEEDRILLRVATLESFVSTVDTNDGFGESVSLFDRFLLVGAPRDERLGVDAGAVFYYELTQDNASAEIWEVQHALVPPELEAGDLFGRTVAMHGNLMAGGAPVHEARLGLNTGAVFSLEVETEPESVFWEISPPVMELQVNEGDSPGNRSFELTPRGAGSGEDYSLQDGGVEWISSIIPSLANAQQDVPVSHTISFNTENLSPGFHFTRVIPETNAIPDNERALFIQLEVIPQEGSFFPGSFRIDDTNWVIQPPFGLFWLSRLPWVYSPNHGWWWTQIATPENSWWFYDSELGFLWASRSAYPYLYSADTQDWLFYDEGSTDPRFFFDFSTGVFRAVPASGR